MSTYRSRVRLSLSQIEAEGLLASTNGTEAGDPEELVKLIGTRKANAFYRAHTKLKAAYWAARERDEAKGQPLL